MHTNAGSALRNPVTLTFDLTVNVRRVPWSCHRVCEHVPSLPLIAQVVYLLDLGETHKVTDATDEYDPTQASATAGREGTRQGGEGEGIISRPPILGCVTTRYIPRRTLWRYTNVLLLLLLSLAASRVTTWNLSVINHTTGIISFALMNHADMNRK